MQRIPNLVGPDQGGIRCFRQLCAQGLCRTFVTLEIQEAEIAFRRQFCKQGLEHVPLVIPVAGGGAQLHHLQRQRGLLSGLHPAPSHGAREAHQQIAKFGRGQPLVQGIDTIFHARSGGIDCRRNSSWTINSSPNRQTPMRCPASSRGVRTPASVRQTTDRKSPVKAWATWVTGASGVERAHALDKQDKARSTRPDWSSVMGLIPSPPSTRIT